MTLGNKCHIFAYIVQEIHAALQEPVQ